MYALGSPEPVTHELVPAIGNRPSVAVTFNAQPSPLSMRAARRAAADALRAGGIGADERAGDAFTAAVIRHNILAWSGLVDQDDQLIEPTPDREITDVDGNVTGTEPGTISAFLADPRLVEAADRKYVLPWALLDAEKNGLSPSPNGTSEGAMPEADTASSSASPESAADAGTTTDDPPAPTSGTKPKRTKAKPSGS